MDNELKKVKNLYRENYYHTDITARIKKGVHQRIADEGPKFKYSNKTKLIYSLGIAAVVFGLLFSSVFISPTMAEVAAKIPYLNQILHLKPLDEVIWDELTEKGYHVEGVGMYLDGDKQLEVRVNGLNEEIKGDIEEIVYNQLESRGYDAYTVIVVEPFQPETKPTELTEKEKLIEDILEATITKLKSDNYNVLTYGYGYASPTDKTVNFYVDIPNTEERIEELKNTFHQMIEGKDIGEYKVNVVTIDLEKQEIENKWSADVFPVIISGMMGKKEYEVTGFAYSFKPETLEIVLKTSIKSTDNDAKERALKVEQTVEEFLTSEELKDVASTYPYKVIVRSKDKKQLN